MIQFKDKNYAYFHNIVLNSVNYDIQAIAHAKGGTTVTNAQQSLREIYKSFLGESIMAMKHIRLSSKGRTTHMDELL